MRKNKEFQQQQQQCALLYKLGVNDVIEMMILELSEVISQERNVVDGQDLCHSNWLIVYNNISQFDFWVNFPFKNSLVHASKSQLAAA